MKVVYVAGKFRGPNHWVVENNIRRAEEVALDLWRMGAAVICPHTNTRFFDGAAPDEIWLEGDIEIMKRCDAVYMVGDWRASKGATAEREVALAAGIPVFDGDYGEFERWLVA